MFNINNELKQQAKKLRESEEGIEVSLFLHSLQKIYQLNENTGTYVCSKMKNFMNNYRHKVKRTIYAELRDHEIISSKVNEIIDTALNESNFEKVLEHFSDISYKNEFNGNFILPTCKIEPVVNDSYEVSSTNKQLPVSSSPSLNISRLSSSDRNGSLSDNTEPKKRTKRSFVQMNQESHIIHLKEFSCVTILKQVLTQELNLEKDALENATIKSFNSATKEWADLKSWKSFKVDGNIQIFYPSENDRKSPELESGTGTGIDFELQVDDPPCSSVDEQVIKYPLEKHIEKIINDYKSSGGKKTWVLKFELPKFAPKLLGKMSKGDPITAKERIQICQVIYDHVSQYDFNPAPSETKIIMKCLFLKYPKLADMDKDYWVTWNIWNMTLVNMFAKNKKETKSADTNKKETKSTDTNKIEPKSTDTNKKETKSTDTNKKETKSTDTNKKEIKSTDKKATPKAKHTPKAKSTKRKSSSVLVSSTNKQKRAKTGPKCSSTPKKEGNRATLESQLNSTQEEIMTNSASLDGVSSAMQATYEERRSQIVSEAWTIEDILISYPWLHNEKEIFAEFSRISHFNKSVDEAIDAGFRKISGALLNILKTQHKSRFVLEKERELRKLSKNPKDFEYKISLFALPFALGEEVDSIFKEMGSLYEEPIQIEYAGGDTFEEGKSFSVIIEDTRIECSSLKSAVAVFFCSFFIYNLAYPSDVKKFLYFVERSLLKIPGKVLPPSPVVKLVGKISEYFADKGENWN